VKNLKKTSGKGPTASEKRFYQKTGGGCSKGPAEKKKKGGKISGRMNKALEGGSNRSRMDTWLGGGQRQNSEKGGGILPLGLRKGTCEAKKVRHRKSQMRNNYTVVEVFWDMGKKKGSSCKKQKDTIKYGPGGKKPKQESW